MLVISRRIGEVVHIGDTNLTILDIRGGQVRLGIDAPPAVRITRDDANRRTPHTNTGGPCDE